MSQSVVGVNDRRGMSGEREEPASIAAETGANGLAARLATTASGEAAADAREYLRKQSRLVDLQIEELRKEDSIRHWSLRVRHVNELLKLAFGLSGALVAILVAVGISALIWNAYQASGLVIQPIKSPPDFVQRGLDGTVLAQRLLDKLNGLVADADKWSFRSADSVSGNWGDNSKVEIPETGISVFELSRFLRQSLGHETSMSGELYHTATGIALTVRVGAGAGTTFEGSERDIDKLLSRAAHTLLAQTQPYRFVWLLYSEGRPAISIAPVARQYVETASDVERPWLQSAHEELLSFSGKFHESVAACRATVASAPDNPAGYIDLGATEWALGHLEGALDSIRAAERLLTTRPPADFAPGAIPFLVANAESFADDVVGAYRDAISADIAESKTGQFDFDISGPAALANDYAEDHDVAEARAVLARAHLSSDDILLQPEYVVTTGPDLPNFYLRADLDDWTGARDALEQTDHAALRRNTVNDVRHSLIWPWLAYAWTRTGQLPGAEALIAQTPLDCTLCLEMRGRVAEAQGNGARAAFWFSRAIHDAPSLPFSYTDWGNLLRGRRDFDGAIAMYRSANQHSPHYADAIELWGEALMLENRSDLARAKFEEANAYAPNWGRLHMKWGEALGYLGRKDQARAQYRIASALEMSVADKAELARDLRD
jgi:tetratricopeptide (TPR) repeat protein